MQVASNARIEEACDPLASGSKPRESELWFKGQKEAFEAAIDGAPLEVSLDILIRSVTEHGVDSLAGGLRSP